jgi:hypothetical protein
MIRISRIVRAVATTVGAAVIAVGIVGCGPTPTDELGSGAHATSSTIAVPLPPPVNEGTPVTGPVSRLRPGTSIMVGDKATKVCMAGFYIDYSSQNLAGKQSFAFLTAAQCARGDSHAPVSVMNVEAPGQLPKRTQIGEVTLLAAGGDKTVVAGEPWTMAISPLAVFSPVKPNWVLPVDIVVNDKAPSSEILQTAQPAEQNKASATWTNSFGAIVTGHVLDPASTPELRDIPGNIQRVVIAADDATQPTYPQVLGSPVTAEVDGSTYNLGIIVDVDEKRRWVVVDLIGPFLAAHGAHLATTS